MAAPINITINQGETFEQGFQWLQGDGITPMVLNGYTGACEIRNGAHNQGVLMTVPVVITDSANGKFTISLTAAQTAALPTSGAIYSQKTEYAYDVEFTSGSGYVYRVINGVISVSPEVTK